MTENKKYELTDDSIQWSGATLYRIRALKSFGNVKKGELGGYVESEFNLSHLGSAWIYGDAKVYGRARVIESGKVFCKAQVYGKAIVSKNSRVSYKAHVLGRAIITDLAYVDDSAVVCGKAIIKDHAKVYGDAWIGGNAIVRRCSFVGGGAEVSHNAEIAVGTPEPFLRTKAVIHGDALISDLNDVLVISPIGSRNDILTACRSKRGDIKVSTGCFKGTLDEFKYQVRNEHGSNVYARQYYMAISFIKQFFKINEGGKNHGRA